MEQAGTIVVPVDFSPMSKHALRAALRMARLTPTRIELLHVIPEYEVESAFHIQLPERAEVETKAQAWAEKAFTDYLRGEDVAGLTLATCVRYGKPALTICRYASEVGADLILIASHGRSGFERAVFGSTAEKVLRICTQPVMIVKGKQPKGDAVP